MREEMDRAGAMELLMPAVQPAELWQETGRWDRYGDLLLRIKDRHERDYCFGPTHEEVITDIARRELRSYRQLPGQLLPDPDQVPRRDPAPLRPDAGARVRDEGRLLLPSGPGLARRDLPGDGRAPTAASSRASACDSGRWMRTPARSAAPGPRNSTCWPTPARTPSPTATAIDFAANVEMAPAPPPESPRAARQPRR